MSKSKSNILKRTKVLIWKEAFKDCLPITAGVIPFGLTCGIMGRTAGFSVFEITFMSLTVFAGAAQFMAIAMINSGILNWGVIVFTTFLINLRHLLMGASLAPHLFKQSKAIQYLLAFSMTDESYALTISRTEKKGYSGYYQLGVSFLLYIVWAIATVIGASLYYSIPNPLEWGLDFIIPLTFLVLLIPRLTSKTPLIVTLVSAVVAVLGSLYLPGKWYIILAALVASVVGGLIEGGRENG
ncbi:AzlC family ABC transporter permease [Alkaliphilus pronyensis]|uniref:AzlC family ABC transporter permease n=1 Tax=Alkaliphilus pronyensis TaxID=1482732 RepID=A0A6I0F1T7_9FIRM|nr:AzlC family ABC transporter permease [Alkaliphilus pronyensis]KAB3530674.1 AzlC family ABC transporter permease [Alkaliphilus pronyensis]